MPYRRARVASAHGPAFEPLEQRALLVATFNGLPLPAAFPNVNVGAVQSIAAADFDGDGATDLAVSFRDATSGTNAPGIAFYRGQNNGLFLAPVFTSLGSRAGELAPIATAMGIPLPVGGGTELLSIGGVGGNDTDGFRRAFVRVYRLNVFTGQFIVQSRLAVDPLPPLPGDVREPIFPGAPLTSDFTNDNRVDVAFALTTSNGRGIGIVERPSLNTLTLNTRLDTPEVYESEQTIDGIAENPLIAADITSDGRMDLIYRAQSAYMVFRNQAAGLAASGVPMGLDPTATWRFTDVNADGRVDAMSTRIAPGPIVNEIATSVSYLRVRLGQGFSLITGKPIFSPLTRVASFPRGPALPFGVLGDAAMAVDRDVFLLAPDLNGDGLTDFFHFRDYSGTDAIGPFAYQRASSLAAPNPPTALPLLWPQPISAIDPLTVTTIIADFEPNVAIGAGLPVFADLNNDGRADLIQSVNGRIEVRLNV